MENSSEDLIITIHSYLEINDMDKLIDSSNIEAINNDQREYFRTSILLCFLDIPRIYA